MLVRWMALAWFVFLPASIQGAPEESGDSADQPGTDTEDAQQTPAEGSGPGEEIFLPTEEISEDFAAPFPVDI